MREPYPAAIFQLVEVGFSARDVPQLAKITQPLLCHHMLSGDHIGTFSQRQGFAQALHLTFADQVERQGFGGLWLAWPTGGTGAPLRLGNGPSLISGLLHSGIVRAGAG